MEIDLAPWFKYLYPILLALIVIEYFNARHLYDVKESLSGMVIAIVASIIASFTKVVAVAIFFVVFELAAPLRESLLGYTSLGWAWYIWILCLVGDDFNFYWHHRLSHSIRLLWAAHLPHHSARTYNFTVSVRHGWFITLYKPIFWLWMPLLGFEPVMIATCLVINAAYQFFLHTQLVGSFGILEKVFNTPWVHQVHHSCNVHYLDKNHGGILIIWDRLFGTFQDQIPGVKAKYGILKDPDTYNPIKHNLYEFQNIIRDVKKAKNAKEVFMYIFGPPGWSPDKSTLTAREMQLQYAEQHAGA
jgi:sterol desaturase/sphingolipid hydroxylase (fatty acid hydroxylase superfamily)